MKTKQNSFDEIRDKVRYYSDNSLRWAEHMHNLHADFLFKYHYIEKQLVMFNRMNKGILKRIAAAMNCFPSINIPTNL